MRGQGDFIQLLQIDDERITKVLPISDVDPIISHLEKVQGSAEKKQEFARLIIDEATRFKKNKLVERLNAWMATFEQTVGQNSRNHVKKTVNR